MNKEESKKKIVNIPEENSYSNGTEIQKWDGSITQYIMAEANSPELKISHDSSKSNLVLLFLMILNVLSYIIRCVQKDTTTEKISTNDINHSDEENRKKENIINDKLKESSSSNDHQCVPTQIKMKKIKIRRL